MTDPTSNAAIPAGKACRTAISCSEVPVTFGSAVTNGGYSYDGQEDRSRSNRSRSGEIDHQAPPEADAMKNLINHPDAVLVAIRTTVRGVAERYKHDI